MIIELSFVIVGGVNLGLEKYWGFIDGLIKKYPNATWKRIVDWKRGRGKYIIEIE